MKYKFNPYNLLIPVLENNEFVLYNTFNGGIEVLDINAGQFLSEVMLLEYFSLTEYIKYDTLIYELVEKEYLVNANVDFVSIAENRYKNQIRNKAKNSIFLTIGTTILCNMGCPYCFEFVKPNNTLKDEKVITRIGEYIESIIVKNPKNLWKNINVTWYGGEPLMNVKAIELLSPILKNICKKYNLDYNANIITNGIYLTPSNTRLLLENDVKQAQVTIDGAKEVHNKNRPLKAKNQKNYLKILENLAQLPKEMGVNLRMNIDKNVANTLDRLLKDLEDYRIWPQRYRNFHFSPAWLRTYDGEEISEEEKESRLNVDDFFDVYQNFRLKQINIFNKWAKNNKIRNAKLAWDLPSYQTDCPTWASPFGIVVDPNGNIHKCWETIHDEKLALATVFEEYSPKKFKKHTNFNRFQINPVCRNCKFLPVCDQISCSHHAVSHKVPQCSYWKSKSEDFIREQYLKMIKYPDTISVPSQVEAINTGHSNK